MRCSTPKPFEKNPAALKTATVGGSGLFAPPGIDLICVDNEAYCLILSPLTSLNCFYGLFS